MARSISIATLNCENLFARYIFKDGAPSASTTGDGFTFETLGYVDVDKSGKTQLTAALIRDADADVICLQEVDSLAALDKFNAQHLNGLRYAHRILIDGNDSRQIDVAVLSRYPIVSFKSHRDDFAKPNELERIFSRDCLRVDVDVEGAPLHLYVNHFKSMSEGRDMTRPKRVQQAERVLEILAEDWGAKLAERSVVVVGDLNDYLETPGDPKSAITGLVEHPDLVNAVDWIKSPGERYTHRFLDAKKRKAERRQLDYILVTKALAAAVTSADRPNAITINRKGMSWWNGFYHGERLSGVGFDKPVASDHALVRIKLNLP